jgi:hypothetical protein
MTITPRTATAAIAAAFAVTALAAPASAQTAESRKAATAVVDLTNPPARSSAALEAQLKAMRNGDALRNVLNQNPGFRQAASQNPAKFDAALARMGAMQADALGPIQREMLTASRTAAIEAYATRFTTAELEAIAAFYRSGPGAKLLAQQGAIGVEVSKQMQTRFGPRVQAAEKSVGPKIDAELRKLSGQPPAPAK